MPEFKIRIARETHTPEEKPGIMTIVIFQPYVHLVKELKNAFKGKEDVKVILDRRIEERRKIDEAVEKEQRRGDRRKPKQGIAEVTISVSTQRPRSISLDDAP